MVEQPVLIFQEQGGDDTKNQNASDACDVENSEVPFVSLHNVDSSQALGNCWTTEKNIDPASNAIAF